MPKYAHKYVRQREHGKKTPYYRNYARTQFMNPDLWRSKRNEYRSKLIRRYLGGPSNDYVYRYYKNKYDKYNNMINLYG